jgi:hypothetical protein
MVMCTCIKGIQTNSLFECREQRKQINLQDVLAVASSVTFSSSAVPDTVN